VPQSGVAEVIDSGTHGLPTHATTFRIEIISSRASGSRGTSTAREKCRFAAAEVSSTISCGNNLALQHILSYPYQEQPVIRDTTLENPIKSQTGSPIIGQLYATDPNIVTPYAVAYSLGVQWQFMPNTLLEVAYVGIAAAICCSSRR